MSDGEDRGQGRSSQTGAGKGRGRGSEPPGWHQQLDGALWVPSCSSLTRASHPSAGAVPGHEVVGWPVPVPDVGPGPL